MNLTAAGTSTDNGFVYKFFKDQYGREYVELEKTPEKLQEIFTAKLKKVGLIKYSETPLDKLNPYRFLNDRSPITLINRINNKRNIFMEGKPGTGKTMLAMALARDIHMSNQHVVVYRWINFLNELKNSFRTDRASTMQDVACNCNLLVMDELGQDRKKAATDFEAETLFDVITARYGSGKPWIITTNLEVDHLERLYGRAVMDRILDSNNSIHLNFNNEMSYRTGSSGRANPNAI